MKRTLVSLIVFCLALSALQSHHVLAERLAIGSSKEELSAIADAYVDEAHPTENYGANESIIVASGKLAYIMFDLSVLPANATIAKAQLELDCYSGTYMIMGSGYISAHYCQDNSWTEGSITWENKPAYESSPTYKETHGMWLGWDYWDVTKDAQTTVMNEDRRLTIVLKNYNIRGSYYSRETDPKYVKLEVEYLTPPVYVITLKSQQDTDESSNIGFVNVSAKLCTLPMELLVKPGSYTLEYDGDYEFLRWETSGSVVVSDKSAQKTAVVVEGAGGLTAIGRAAKLNLGSAQDRGITSNIGYMVIDNLHFSLPAEIPVIRPGTHAISYEGGYKFIRWETSGAVSVPDPYSSNTTIIVSAGQGTLTAIGSIETMEYAYDCGRSEQYSYLNGNTGEMWAVGFTPLFSGRLLTAQFYISDEPAPIEIHVLDQNKSDIISPFTQTPPSNGWFDVDLSRFNLWVKARTDFYIGIKWTVQYKPDLGYDSSEPMDRRSWHWNGTEWYSYPESWRDLMIRAVVETQMLESKITCSISPTSVPYMGTTTITGSISPSDPETASGTVTIQFSPDRVLWHNVDNVSCVASSYSYSWVPGMPVTNYLVRAVWQGSDTYFGAESEPQSLTITKAQTTLTCRFDVDTATTDETVLVLGSISPPISGVNVILVFTPPDGAVFNQPVMTSTSGSFRFETRLSKEGTWSVKAYWPGDENRLGCESTPLQLEARARSAPFPYYIVGFLGIVAVAIAVLLLGRRRMKKRRFAPPPSAKYPPPPPVAL